MLLGEALRFIELARDSVKLGDGDSGCAISYHVLECVVVVSTTSAYPQGSLT